VTKCSYLVKSIPSIHQIASKAVSHSSLFGECGSATLGGR
jgi:hypothetical protein